MKWVDETHAIGIFSTAVAAQDSLLYQHPMAKIRPIAQASRPTKLKAKNCSGIHFICISHIDVENSLQTFGEQECGIL